MRRILGIALALVVACSDDKKSNDASSDDVVEFELFASTHELSSTALGDMTPDVGDGVLVFDETPTELIGVNVGDVLLAGISPTTPKGLLRFVTKVEQQGDGLTLSTVDAPIQAAFRKLHVQLASRTTSLGATSATPQSVPGRTSQALTGGKTIDFDEVGYDGDGNASTTDDQVRIKGTVGGTFDFLLGIDTDWGVVDALPTAIFDCVTSLFDDCSIDSLLPEVKAGFSVNANAEASAQFTGAPFLSYVKEVPIPMPALEPFAIGPLVFVPRVTVVGRILGEASSQFSLSAGARAGINGGVSFSTSDGADGSLPKPTAEFDAPAAEVALSAKGRVEVESKLRVALYDLFGPYAGVTAYAEMTADQTATPCWSANAGIDGFVGFDIAVYLGDSYGYATLANAKSTTNLVDSTIAQGACSLPPGSSSLPVGAGPDAEHLANPTFTPWANVTEATDPNAFEHGPFNDAWPYSDDGYQTTSIARTIDGAVAVTGRGSRALAKVREDGTAVWAAMYDFADDGAGVALNHELIAVASLANTNLLVLAEPYTAMQVDQYGNFVSMRTYDIPSAANISPIGDRENRQFWSVTRASDGGAFIAGTQTDPGASEGRLWLMRTDVNGEVVWSKRYSAGVTLYPTVLVAYDDGVWVAASTYVGGSAYRPLFVMRVDNSGQPAFARLYSHDDCTVPSGSPDELMPQAGTLSKTGDLLLVGHAGYYSTSFVARIQTSGALGTFVAKSYPDGVTLTGIVELPTGGFLIDGVTVPTTYSHNVVVAKLDSSYAVEWERNISYDAYSFVTPRVFATDDGGALVLDNSYRKVDNGSIPDGGGILGVKVYAKDGSVTLSSVADTSTDEDLAAITCTSSTIVASVTVSDYAPASHSSTATRTAVPTTATSFVQ